MTPSGTPISSGVSAEAQRPPRSNSTPVSIRWRITSSTKNGLPSVCSWTVPTSAGGRLVPGVRGDQRADAALVQAVERDALEQPVAAQVGEQLGERVVGADLGLAVGADDQQRRLVRRPHHVPQQVQRRAVGPVQVVEDEQRAARARTPRVSSAETASKSR